MPFRAYRKPQEIPLIECEIDATNRNIELLRGHMAQMTAARHLTSTLQTPGMAIELDDYLAAARANISYEQQHLGQLQVQLRADVQK